MRLKEKEKRNPPPENRSGVIAAQDRPAPPASALKPPPLVPLTRFQHLWIEDQSRYKIGAKARRIGFTFAGTLEMALDMIQRRSPWLFISRTQDTAKEGLQEMRNHFEAMGRVARNAEARKQAKGASEIGDEDTELFFRDMRVKKFFIELPNGSRIIAMTAHQDAARGFGGNVFLDEHGFHEHSRELWKGAMAATLRGHKMRVVSTPHYQEGHYFDLARACDLVSGRPPLERRQGIWSAHWVDIHAAAPQLKQIGVPLDLGELRELAGDEETWAQEFCCQFLSAAEMWIAPELIARARSGLATTQWDFDAEAGYEGAGRLYAGLDIGRYRDLTVLYINRRVNETNICRGLIALERMPFPEQCRVILGVLLHPDVVRVCADNTGMGVGLCDFLEADERVRWKLERVTFTLESKELMMVLLRRRMEEGLDKIPENARPLEVALGSIKATPSALGHRRFDAARTEQAKHADHAWAMALADAAAEAPRGYVPASECGLVGSTVMGRMLERVF